ncbi:MAG: ArsR/SmtB family transcription factor [Candidatus Kariarchaeaceae archaeon]
MVSTNEVEKNKPSSVKVVEIVSNPEQIKVLMDKTRREILTVLKKGIEIEGEIMSYELSVPQIAEVINATPQKIYHHIDVLEENGFIRIAKEERRKRSTVTFYERTALVFYILAKASGEKGEIEKCDTGELMLNVFGIDVSEKEKEEINQVITLFQEAELEAVSEISKKFVGEVPRSSVEYILTFLVTIFMANNPSYKDLFAKLDSLLLSKIDVQFNSKIV